MAPTWRTEAGRSPGRDSGTRLCLRKPCRPLSALTLRMGTEVGEAGAAREGADPVTDDGVKTGRDAAQRNLTRPSKSEISPFATTRMGPESIYHAERDSEDENILLFHNPRKFRRGVCDQTGPSNVPSYLDLAHSPLNVLYVSFSPEFRSKIRSRTMCCIQLSCLFNLL